MLAPTGTIGFMMDCDTTGIEPDLALVKQKRLVGGGVIKIVNNTVPQALMKLGYSPEQMFRRSWTTLTREGKIEGAPGLKPEHLPVFDCSLTPMGGGRSISWRGHLHMMAAAQPFLSGAISKTINMPEESTVEDIMEAYIESWKFGLKAVAIYRDNSKRSQPLSAAGKKEEKSAASASAAMHSPSRQWRLRRLQPVPTAGTFRGRTTAESCRLSAARSPTNSPWAATKATSPSACMTDGNPGEIFIKMAKEGSTLSGIMDAFALSVSISLQYGVPLRALVDKFCQLALRAFRLHGQPEDSLREVGSGLHRALARRRNLSRADYLDQR